MTKPPFAAASQKSLYGGYIFHYKASDGLQLGGVQWLPDHSNQEPPVICLPGLTRNHRDFTKVAVEMAKAGFRVIAFDYRGRGLSDRDPTWENYSLEVEGQDIDDGLSYLGVEIFSLLGTSRGGLHAMALAARLPADRINKIILNDIGPVLERDGLARISATVGSNMTPGTWEAAAAHLEKNLGPDFPDLVLKEWLAFAQQLCIESEGDVVFDYDAALLKTLPPLDRIDSLPDLWPLFGATYQHPCLILRGENSHLLSSQTYARMLSEHPKSEGLEVRHEGHAPLLWDKTTQEYITSYLR